MPDVQLVVILLIPTILAVAFAFVPRRSPATPLNLIGVWLVLVVVAVTAVGDRLAAEWEGHQASVSRTQAVLVLAACVLFAWWNRHGRPVVRASVLAVALGAGLNAAATLAYGGMPVLRSAALDAGNSAADLAGPHPKIGYVLSDDRGWFAHYAGDFIPVPGTGVVFSIGDILLWAGLAVLLALTFRSVAPVRDDSSRSAAV